MPIRSWIPTKYHMRLTIWALYGSSHIVQEDQALMDKYRWKVRDRMKMILGDATHLLITVEYRAACWFVEWHWTGALFVIQVSSNSNVDRTMSTSQHHQRHLCNSHDTSSISQAYHGATSPKTLDHVAFYASPLSFFPNRGRTFTRRTTGAISLGPEISRDGVAQVVFLIWAGITLSFCRSFQCCKVQTHAGTS